MDRVVEIIAALYEAATDPERWPDGLKLITEAFSAVRTQVVVGHLADGLQATDTFGYRCPEEVMTKYASYYHKIDPRVPNMSRFLGAGCTGDQLVDDPDMFRRSEFYNDLLLPYEAQNQLLSFSSDRKTWFLCTSIHCGPGSEATRERALFEAILPHLHRAAQLRVRIGAIETGRQTADSVLDSLDCGVILVDRQCRVVHANHMASDLLRLADGLTAIRGVLTAKVIREGRILQRLVGEAGRVATGEVGPPGGAVRISRLDGRPLAILVSPIRLKHRVGTQVPTVAVFIRDPDRHFDGVEQVLAELYGLTPAEARVASALMAGLSVREIAERHATSVTTVRSQLSALLAKTGTGRQGELVALLHRQVGPLGQ